MESKSQGWKEQHDLLSPDPQMQCWWDAKVGGRWSRLYSASQHCIRGKGVVALLDATVMLWRRANDILIFNLQYFFRPLRCDFVCCVLRSSGSGRLLLVPIASLVMPLCLVILVIQATKSTLFFRRVVHKNAFRKKLAGMICAKSKGMAFGSRWLWPAGWNGGEEDLPSANPPEKKLQFLRSLFLQQVLKKHSG